METLEQNKIRKVNQGMESQIKGEKGKEKRENREDLLSSLGSATTSRKQFSRRLLTSEQGNLYQAHEYFTGEQIQAAWSTQNCPSHSEYFSQEALEK